MFKAIMSALHAPHAPRFALISSSHVQPEVLQVVDRMGRIMDRQLSLPRVRVRWVRRAPFWWLRLWRLWLTRPATPPHLRQAARFPAAFLQATKGARLDFGGVFLPDPDTIFLERPPQATLAYLLLVATIVAHEARHCWQHREGWDMTKVEAIEADVDRFVFQEMAQTIYRVAGQPEPLEGIGGQEGRA